MNKFLQHSSETAVTCRHRSSAPRTPREVALDEVQAANLASYADAAQAPRAATAPATPAARRLQGWRVP